jgi:Zn-dependent protease
MKDSFKIFDFYNTPVYIKYWFLILILFVPVTSFVVIFVSVLIHELAHSYVAKRLGCGVSQIYLSLLNGAADIDTSKSSHKEIIYIVLAGPLSNLILYLIMLPFGSIDNALIDEMIRINLILFIFNLLPIYPLDGGRISKAIFSLVLGNKRGKLYNGIFSMIVCILSIIACVIFSMYILAVIAGFLLVASYYEIK